ncbi:MAG: DEAD/DEAH box helicase [Candidatus Marsarchaeota archaeon]|nr:DEAD/DEAH box helicase [Candidatus Marsarchaeota archaeon]
MSVDERWLKLGSLAELLNLDGVEFRQYQFNIISSVLKHGSTLVVLPTGLGKTLIGLSVIASEIEQGRRALLLAPTRPLSEQHYATVMSAMKLPEESVALLLGSVGKKRRKELEQSAKLIIATPQTIANDLKSGNFSLADFGVAVFDECHRAVGKYAYTYIANELAVRNALVLGLTASPGSKKEKINALVGTLNIKHIEARISTDPDVVSYVMPKYMHVVSVPQSSTIKSIAATLKPVGEESLASLNKMGLMNAKNFDRIPRGVLIALGNSLKKISAPGFRFGAFFSYVKLLNISHAYDLLMTEGIYPFSAYMDSLTAREEKSRAVENLLANKNVTHAMALAKEAIKRGEEHEKVKAAISVLKQYSGKSAIVFVQYRSTIKMLVDAFQASGIDAMPFVGKKEGVTQEKQKKVIEEFRNGKFSVLVASSIGEEGLDIPSVDLVLFYEPIPNEIRNIQRKGRTARFRAGDVYILAAQGTKDEIYLHVSAAREKKMLYLINEINRELARQAAHEGQTRLRA